MGDLTMLHREVHADMIRLISHTCNHPCCAEHRVIDTAKPIATDCKVQATLYHAKLSGTDKASFDVHVHGFELILILILVIVIAASYVMCCCPWWSSGQVQTTQVCTITVPLGGTIIV